VHAAVTGLSDYGRCAFGSGHAFDSGRFFHCVLRGNYSLHARLRGFLWGNGLNWRTLAYRIPRMNQFSASDTATRYSIPALG